MKQSVPRAAVLSGAIAMTAGVGVLLLRPFASTPPAPAAPAPPPCRAELRSWVVAPPHPGRHLFLQIDCGPAHGEYSGRVEFTSAAIRDDFSPGDSQAPRVARMTRGVKLRPLTGSRSDTERLEFVYELTIEQAACLQRDRMWAAPYQLLGTNSSSGMRAALEECGCELPEAILRGGGVLGVFPGINLSPGSEVAQSDWGEFGLPGGPTPIPDPSVQAEGVPSDEPTSLHPLSEVQGADRITRG